MPAVPPPVNRDAAAAATPALALLPSGPLPRRHEAADALTCLEPALPPRAAPLSLSLCSHPSTPRHVDALEAVHTALRLAPCSHPRTTRPSTARRRTCPPLHAPRRKSRSSRTLPFAESLPRCLPAPPYSSSSASLTAASNASDKSPFPPNPAHEPSLWVREPGLTALAREQNLPSSTHTAPRAVL